MIENSKSNRSFILNNDNFIFTRGDHQPTRFFFVDCLGRKVFVKATTRKKAQDLCNEYTGRKNLYLIRDTKTF